ncbi:hypothetical protein P886_1675 [Alteromonadaceae bacterium 2753L.S.0a.02]|nr:hypothetical protein P886_1675 [Alteromonadaceae bacterium 2753L.S.0a.02]
MPPGPPKNLPQLPVLRGVGKAGKAMRVQPSRIHFYSLTGQISASSHLGLSY